MASVEIAMIAGPPYTALRDAVLTYPTLVEGLIPLFHPRPSRTEWLGHPSGRQHDFSIAIVLTGSNSAN